MPRRGGGGTALPYGTDLKFPDGSFDAAVATFLFCVLPDRLQLPALRELGRVVKPGGFIRLLEYVRPQGALRRVISRIWQPWLAWAYGVSFDRQTDKYLPAAGLELHESRYVVEDLAKLICARSCSPERRRERACIDVQESGVIRPSNIHQREENNG